ncbi:MAG: hypothetical protein JWN03_7223 [Nocardia sp.]|uniref:hypothetical protein n=1 Tax=Nocardia sp. TaxID=1821 RepID=UPI00261A819B|nr:hypothetical protein [Nocardia sp.]MCU1646948.1 hypothetical protein [Nocardia sp.]
MQIPSSLYAGVVAIGFAVAALPAAAATAAPVSDPQSPPSVVRDGGAVSDAVPPGGLITSFLRNQVTYCSIICPLAAQTATSAATTIQQAPGTLSAAWQVDDPVKALGITAASITGPTTSAAQRAIVADGTIVAPRALNAFEVGVVGLLDVGPAAAAGGLPAIVTAVQTARQDTYTALNVPIVPNPEPTVAPHDAVQAAVVGVIDAGAAVIFPAFNTVVSAAFQAPDAAAQELAATGDPDQALAAGMDTVAAAQTAADTIITDAVTRAVDEIRVATQ